MQGLDTLPPWAQVVLSIATFLAVAFAWLRGMFKNLPAPTRDVVVPSVTVADGAVINRLTETLRETNRLMEGIHDRDLHLQAEFRRMGDQMLENKFHLQNLIASARK